MTYPASYPNWVFSLFSCLGFVIVCIPLPWHLEAWNAGTCLYMAWTALACFNQFVNSIIWYRNAINWAPIWCDISSRIIATTAVAISAASLCINRRLYHIASARKHLKLATNTQRRRQVMVDLAIGLGLPVLEVVLCYIPQGHRFDIFEEIGCWPAIYETWVAITLVNVPPVLIGLVSAAYGILSIRAFMKVRIRSKELSVLLPGSSNLTSGRYIRLMLLSVCYIMCTVPLAAYVIYENTNNMRPWISWQDTHFNFSRVNQTPAMLWRKNPALETGIEKYRWIIVVNAFVFFGFFGFAEEARKNYHSATRSVAKHVRIFTTGSGAQNVVAGFPKVPQDNMCTLPVQFPEGKLDQSHGTKTTNLGPASLGGPRLLSLDMPNGGVEKGSNATNICRSREEGTSGFISRYSNVVLPDVSGTVTDTISRKTSPTPGSSSPTPKISIPEPAATRIRANGMDLASTNYATVTPNSNHPAGPFACKDPSQNSHMV